MSTLWIAVVALAIPPLDTTPPAAAPSLWELPEEEPLVSPRTGRGLLDVVHAALGRWARPTDEEAEPAARHLLMLYRELEADPKLAAEQREPLMAKIRSRLRALQRQIEKRIAIEKRLAKAEGPKTVDAATRPQNVLAQWGGFGGAVGRPGFGGGMIGGGMGGQFGGGQFGGGQFGGGQFGGGQFGGGRLGGGPFGGGQFGGGPFGVQDNGDELVELIQATIAPSSWNVNGGLGSIYYWRPGMAIVVRNRGEVHRQIGGLLEQFNRMGR